MKTPRSLLTRSIAGEVELVGDGRTLEGVAIEWDRPALVAHDPDHPAPYLEAFERGSVTKTLRDRGVNPWPLFRRHEHLAGSVGETTFHPSRHGLMFRARAADTVLAAQALDEYHAGKLGAVSIGFYGVRHRHVPSSAGVVESRTEIALVELSLADAGVHPGARVLSVRHDAGTATPRLDAHRRAMRTIHLPPDLIR